MRRLSALAEGGPLLQMDSSCDELEACVPINAVLNTASPRPFGTGALIR